MTSTIERIAHHEAGHVIAECRWGSGAPEYATIREQERPGVGLSLGHVQPQPGTLFSWAPTSMLVNQELSFARFLLAGYAAEEIYTGKPHWGAEADPEYLAECGSHEEAEHGWFNGAYLFVPEFREACDHVRAAFPRTKTPRGHRRKVEQEYRAVVGFLRSHWAHVTAVARALLKRRHLGTSAILRSLAKLPPLDRTLQSEPTGIPWRITAEAS